MGFETRLNHVFEKNCFTKLVFFHKMLICHQNSFGHGHGLGHTSDTRVRSSLHCIKKMRRVLMLLCRYYRHFYSKSWSQSKKIIRTCRLSRESCCSRCNVDHRKFVHWSSDCNSGLFLIILEIHFSDFLVIFMPFSNKDIILNNWIPMKKKNEFQVRISLVSKCTKLK